MDYRPALWESAAVARSRHAQAMTFADIGLPMREDEAALTGFDDPAPIDRAWRAGGVGEVVVKLGDDGCFADGTVRPVPTHVVPIDTTGAGDAFNAGYPHAWRKGLDVADSVVRGHRLAGHVVGRRGGIPMAVDAHYGDLR